MRHFRTIIRRHAPLSLRRQIASFKRSVCDTVDRSSKRIVRANPDCAAAAGWVAQISSSQPIRKTEHSSAKVENLRLAARRLSSVVVPPGGIISFWALVGVPDAKNGFMIGRSIVDDELKADVGGGLCQISGITYELGLRGGLGIVERYPHTLDIYNDETRFAPLGMDATVVWAFKDLRLLNGLDQPVAFSYRIEPDRIDASLLAPAPIREWSVRTSHDESGPRKLVRTYRSAGGSEEVLVSRDSYLTRVIDDRIWPTGDHGI